MELDHEKLDVYRVAVDFAAWSYQFCRGLEGVDRHARDQLLRASQSIALNIAEGSGKRSPADRGRFMQIASGSARECGAILDILARCSVLGDEQALTGKRMLVRIVSMLTKLTRLDTAVREDEVVYADADDAESDRVTQPFTAKRFT